MKNFNTNILLCLTAVSISGAIHHPKVYEDDAEYDKNENIRTARNSESTYRTVHQPPVFNFESAKQQDYRKFRYVEQQKMNSGAMVNGMIKNHRYINHPQMNGKDTDDWQPFDPKMTKVNTKNVAGLNHFKSNKDVKLYKTNTLKVGIPLKNNHFILSNTDNPFKQQIGISNFTATGNSDLSAQGSETIEKKIDSREIPNEYNNIVFVHPNQLQEHLNQNSDDKLNVENSDVNVKKPEAQLTALSDLIGKNPNIQLEGLKRLLQDTASKQYNFPVREGDNVATTENKINTPNVQINHDDNSITLQTPHLIGKDKLEDIQKQLDEAAKIQTEQVLARAQQEAQAQVEAQHKAIALAQVEAQKIALENIQKSIYGNAQALPLVQNSQGEYHAVANNVEEVEPQAQPITINQNIPLQHNIIHKPKSIQHSSSNALDNDDSIKRLPQSGSKSRVVTVIHPKRPAELYGNINGHSFGSKEVLYYAPNHHHQVAAQLQAEKALLSQVQAQNMAILQGHKNVPSTLRQILKEERVSSAEAEEASSIHSETESKPEATAYQQFILESKEVENGGGEQKDYDDFDDLQYAAKYAFGYRIKDAKEGNDFGHEERREGKNLEGSYHVLLPDGRLQKVEYYADNSGYHAKVTYEHLAHDEEHA